MWLGSKRNSKETPLDIVWPDVPVKALGVYFSYDAAAAEKSNFELKIKDLKTILNIWKSISLTWSGKVLLVKTFALSQLIYLASIIFVPNHVIEGVDKVIYDFVWNGGRGMINRNAFIRSYEEGGLKMVDTKSMIKALQIKWIQ